MICLLSYHDPTQYKSEIADSLKKIGLARTVNTAVPVGYVPVHTMETLAKKFSAPPVELLNLDLICRGGVENTRLKAKDTKKIRGQGQGQTLLRPRTGMLEAKDQGHKHKCSPEKKKRSSQKFFKHFESNLYKKTFSKKFFKRSTKF